jgi:PIN domain nuclease of toxin-antitoxin system
VVLDASAVLAWRDREPGALDVVDPLLSSALVCAVNGGEIRYKAAETGDDPDALVADLVALGVEFVPFTDRQARHLPGLRELDRAAREGRRGGKPGRLSLADLCCLALAVEIGARVVTGDQHWTRLVAHGLAVTVTDYRR